VTDIAPASAEVASGAFLLSMEPMTIAPSIEEAVTAADVPVLLVSVAHLTGDYSILRDEFRPDTSNLFDPNAGLSEETMAKAREAATETLARHLSEGGAQAPAPSDTQLTQAIAFLVGDDAAQKYMPILREELGLDDLRAPSWRVDGITPGKTWTVAVIGAGMSGLAVAHRLRQAGVEVTVFDKNDEVGGTWYENTYPGCRVDVPNHLYSYSFLQTTDWPGFFSDQTSLLSYFRRCADELGLRECIRLQTEVESMTFDDESQTWTLLVRTSEGMETHEFNAVCSAVGQLNRPHFPEIEGMDRFEGPSFHSAEWDHSVDLKGKRVGVIGTGASAAQFIPEIAEEAGQVVVFQRTPPWLAPTPNYHDELPVGVRHLIESCLPSYVRWDRLWLFWRTHEGMLPAAKVDPDWPNKEQSISELNEMMRQFLIAYIRSEIPEDELFEKVVPNYPPAAKRMLRDNGAYTQALRRDNVDLHTNPIAEITEAGVSMEDGTTHALDVIIYGTGFHASKFLMPMKVTGTKGADLHERWDGDARAYLGMTVPEFPNMFMLYGPNTNIVINGSIIYFSECEAHYILECMRMLLENDHRSLECRRGVYDDYNEVVDRDNRNMAWGASSVNTWYKNEKGRVTQNWPYSLFEYWERTRTPNPSDYILR
jgi:4-hydroxyacetophenone monooxygenase